MKPNRVNALLIAPVLTGLLLVGLLVYKASWLQSLGDGLQPGPAPKASTESSAPTVARETHHAAPPNLGVWVRGRSLHYAADFGSKITSDPDEPDGWFSILGSVKMLLVVEEATDALVRLQGRLSGLSLVLENEQTSGRRIEDVARAALERPFVLTLTRRGRIESLAVEPGVGGIGHNILRHLVSGLQFVWPDDLNSDLGQWHTQETDQHGVYRARYESVGPNQFLKTKLTYTSLAMAEKLARLGAQDPVEIDSKTAVTVDGDGVVHEAKNQEKLVLPLGQEGLKTESHVTLVLKESSLATRVVALNSAHMRAAPLDEVRSPAARPEAARNRRRQELVAGASFDRLTSELAATQDPDARIRMMGRMEALFDLDPRSIDEAVRRLRRGSPLEETEVVLGALAGAKHPHAQRALLELAQAAPPGVQEAAVTQLGLHEAPTEETTTGLRRLAEEAPDHGVRASAALALGGAMRRQGAAEDGGSVDQASVDYLVASYEAAESVGEQRLYLDALGNAGSPEALELASSAMAADDSNLRAAAVAALRHVGQQDVDPLVAQVLAEDPDTVVRLAAISVARERGLTPETERAAVGVLEEEEDVSVRNALVDLLGGSAELSEAALAALQRIAEDDASEQLRQAATRALQR